MPIPSTIHASALPEVNFLVSSVKKPKENKKNAHYTVGILTKLMKSIPFDIQPSKPSWLVFFNWA